MIRNVDETITMADIRVAMILGRPVTIDYERADGTRTVRVVEPFEIVERENVTRSNKRAFFRAMDRQSHDYRSFRFDRLYAYRVANARSRYKVARPAPLRAPELTVITGKTSHEVLSVDLDAEWGAWLESQYDPDAPIPYLPTLYEVNEEK